MDVSNTPSQVATTALTAIPFSNIIGAPLNACITAQAQAAEKTWEFINNVGLQEKDGNGVKEAVNVSFTFNQNGSYTKLNIPLLTIVPIPYIAIQNIDIAFKANISASSSSYTETSSSSEGNFEASGHGKAGWGPFSVSVDLKGGYSSKKDSRATQDSKYSVEYTMDVGLRAGQESMSAGLAKVLEILNNSLTISDPKGTLAVNATSFKLGGDNGDKVSLTATYMSPEGLYDPTKIKLTNGNSELNGNVDGNSKVFELNAAGTYTVSVDGQEDLRKEIEVS